MQNKRAKKHYEYTKICPKLLTYKEYYDRAAVLQRITKGRANAQSPISLHFIPYHSIFLYLITYLVQYCSILFYFLGVIRNNNMVKDNIVIYVNRNISSLVLLFIWLYKGLRRGFYLPAFMCFHYHC